MKSLLLLSTLFLFSFSASTQDRFVSADYNEYFEWFNERSQTPQQYEKGALLYVFGHDIKVFNGPCEQAEVVTQLAMGQQVRNLVSFDEAFNVTEEEINGYGDIWYQVGGKDKAGKTFSGYLWGGHLAKAWTLHDFTGDNRKELVMLGLSPSPKKSLKDIKAEIRILQDDHLLYQKIVPGLCVFEDCGSSVLLRILPDAPVKGAFMLEASTMTISCFAGIEKAFYSWDGGRLELVFHAEFTNQHQYANQAFKLSNDQGSVQLCRFSHEDKNYEPVWACKVIELAPPKDNAENKPKAVPLVRAR
ncbi:MAG: hypothetical protein R2828_25075 [Saprospiraceae bacterium]